MRESDGVKGRKGKNVCQGSRVRKGETTSERVRKSHRVTGGESERVSE